MTPLLKSFCFLASLLPTMVTAAALPMDTIRASARHHPNMSAVYILEKGEESLLARAWLAESAQESIDVQYFIWSTDNIGTLASEALLSAAERGVTVRVIVDDLLIDAKPETILSLSAHPNIQIKIYNPMHSVGVNIFTQLWNLLTNFRDANQRMHDKVVIYDQTIAITGGRNMADEYYDYDHEYNFRDRDVMLSGNVLPKIETSFNAFWESPLAVPLEQLLADERKSLSSEMIKNHTQWLHRYAQNPSNFSPEVRASISDMGPRIDDIFKYLRWTNVEYIHDIPGKNNMTRQLDGGGETTSSLINLLSEAKQSIVIESPYLIMPEEGFAFFSELIDKGVSISIVTNSLASTDNLQAYSGYYNQKQHLINLGINIYEFKPNPAIMQSLIDRYEVSNKQSPVFALHAKSLVVDAKAAYIGTFNFDPRSTNLNTEVGVIIRDPSIAQQVEQAIRQDMAPENSWNVKDDDSEQNSGFLKRIQMRLWALLPLDPIL